MNKQKERPTTAIALPSYNLLEYTQRCLTTVSLKTPFYLVLIDNGSEDGTGAFFRDLARAKNVFAFVLPENGGCAAGWNLAVQFSMEQLGCDKVIVLNNDTLLLPGTLDILLKDLDLPDVGMATAKDISGRCVDEAAFFKRIPSNFGPYPETPDFSCFGVNKKCIEKVGYFDEMFYPAYFEDNDYHFRMKGNSLKAVCDLTNYYWHYGSRTKKQDPMFDAWIRERYVANRAYYIEKWGGEPGHETYSVAFLGEEKPRATIETYAQYKKRVVHL